MFNKMYVHIIKFLELYLIDHMGMHKFNSLRVKTLLVLKKLNFHLIQGIYLLYFLVIS